MRLQFQAIHNKNLISLALGLDRLPSLIWDKRYVRHVYHKPAEDEAEAHIRLWIWCGIFLARARNVHRSSFFVWRQLTMVYRDRCNVNIHSLDLKRFIFFNNMPPKFRYLVRLVNTTQIYATRGTYISTP
jgi:hypothetical protein